MQTFKKGDKIGRYTVDSFVKKGVVTESYSAFGTDDKLYFVKVFDFNAIPKAQLFEGKEVYEIQLCKELVAENCVDVIRYVDNGEVRKNNTNFHYLVTEYYRGGLLSEAVEKDGVFDPEDAAQITLCVLDGLAYIHSRALIHNDLRPSNIMLQELEDGMLQPTIIDLGHISYMVMGRPTFYVEDLHPFFRAPETFRGIFTQKSDIFSVGATLYYLIFGVAPWQTDISACEGVKDLVKKAVNEARKKELVLETEDIKIPDYLKNILQKALAKKPDDRFESVTDFAKALAEQVMPELAKQIEESEKMNSESVATDDNANEAGKAVSITIKKGSGNGFDNVAGRNELKEQLRKEVLFALQNPEKAQKYQLPSVNGILLYGPPGCGKSLVLESVAEESGFNYSVIKASDFGNIYQDGILDNLQRVFDAASIKAPFVICIDELEYLVPSHGDDGNITPQIAALFGTLNGCAQKGILVVATTSQPELVDQAIVRAGCFDAAFFVSPPDFEARKDIFKAHLSGRPCEELDFDELAKMSDDFNAGDITETVNEAATSAAYNDMLISQKMLVDVLRYKNPTYSTKTKIGFCK